jgi:hypothetical protein
MPNRIDPNDLICASCEETRPHKFDLLAGRAGVERDMAPEKDLQKMYLCRYCASFYDRSAQGREMIRQDAIHRQVAAQRLTGGFSPRLWEKRRLS